MLKYIPNTLTIIRFLLIPLILFTLFTNHYFLAFILVVLSVITDVADGFIARKFNFVSNFGKLMDPLADKLTQICVITALVLLHFIPLWILLVVVIKECTMIVGASFLYGKDVVVYSRWYGKLATSLFNGAMALSILTKAFGLSDIWDTINLVLFIIASIMTVVSLILYIHDLSIYGVIDKSDLKKDVQDISIKKSRK